MARKRKSSRNSGKTRAAGFSSGDAFVPLNLPKRGVPLAKPGFVPAAVPGLPSRARKAARTK